jgi:hypothetical protein
MHSYRGLPSGIAYKGLFPNKTAVGDGDGTGQYLTTHSLSCPHINTIIIIGPKKLNIESKNPAYFFFSF